MSKQYDEWCESATFTKKEINEINRACMEYALENGIVYHPYIPVMCSEGPIVKPEEQVNLTQSVINGIHGINYITPEGASLAADIQKELDLLE